MNKIILIGNLTRDPDPVRTTPGGTDVCSFTIAVDRKAKDNNGNKVTDYFRINAWGKIAMPCHNYLAKGKKVGVSGELQARLTESNGKHYMNLDVRADEVEFLSTNAAPAPEPTLNLDELKDVPESDLPF